jgi:hypothetical protein
MNIVQPSWVRMVIKEGAHMCAVMLMEAVAVAVDALVDVLVEAVAKEVNGCLFVVIALSRMIHANIAHLGVGVGVEMSILSAQIVQRNILLNLVLPIPLQYGHNHKHKYQHPCW